ncbi:MAG: CHRD domain-containing protein [Gemmatimonadetes bacterium]|nr:CHRD domain-containing protein [Gemmatimonadota bacterium]
MKRTFVRSATLVAAVGFLAAGCEGDVGPAGVQGPAGPAGPAGPTGPAATFENFNATLSGANEVPAVTTSATGTARLSLVGPTLLYRIDVASITGVTASHIHGPAPAGVNTGVRVNLCGAGSAPACATGTVTGVLVTGTVTSVSGISFDSVLVLMRSGNAYVNVHTSANPGGEIRGQVARQ